MQTAYSLEEITKSSLPVILTIGNFDGLHLGHQAILEHLVQIAKKRQARSAVLTFCNHPSTVLRPSTPTPFICTTEHKVQLLDEASIDLVLFLSFTKLFSEQSADIFLHRVKQYLPFETLILGSDAHIGKNREGDCLTVTRLAETLEFHVEYLPDYIKSGQRISSSLIRSHIRQGDLKQAEALLGRPYSIYGPVLKGSGRGAPLGFPTANLAVSALCLPPFGVYAVGLCYGGRIYPGVANLGIAPTVRHESEPILEVHLYDEQIDLYGKAVNVIFHDFIRQEKRFENIEDLRKEIAKDILKAKQIQLRNGSLKGTPL